MKSTAVIRENGLSLLPLILVLLLWEVTAGYVIKNPLFLRASLSLLFPFIRSEIS